MNLIFLGPPGSGKGTQAKKIENKFNIPQISTGDLLRMAIKNNTKIGKLAQNYMDKGQLVPDDIVLAIVRERINNQDCKNGFILDGFPRTIAQAKAIETLNINIDAVIYFQVSDNEVIKRISGRRVCSKCNAMYHIIFMPPRKNEICDKCGSSLIQRDDDKEEVVINRLKVYSKNTKPLLDFYSKKNKLYQLQGELEVEEVYKELVNLIENLKE